MLIKRIVCVVKQAQQEAFDLAQRQWVPLSGVQGFWGQVGGWQKNVAVVFSFWENELMYDRFMKEAHDEIFLKSNQANTYSSISVSFWFTSIRIVKKEWKEILTIIDSISLDRTDLDGFTVTAQSADSNQHKSLILSFLSDRRGDLALYDPWTVLPKQ